MQGGNCFSRKKHWQPHRAIKQKLKTYAAISQSEWPKRHWLSTAALRCASLCPQSNDQPAKRAGGYINAMNVVLRIAESELKMIGVWCDRQHCTHDNAVLRHSLPPDSFSRFKHCAAIFVDNSRSDNYLEDSTCLIWN
jgi:hypothetical protein